MKMIVEFEKRSCHATAKQVIDILRGKTVKSNQIKASLIDQFKGKIRTCSESEIRRIILQLLKNNIIKEKFVQI